VTTTEDNILLISDSYRRSYLINKGRLQKIISTRF